MYEAALPREDRRAAAAVAAAELLLEDWSFKDGSFDCWNEAGCCESNEKFDEDEEEEEEDDEEVDGVSIDWFGREYGLCLCDDEEDDDEDLWWFEDVDDDEEEEEDEDEEDDEDE